MICPFCKNEIEKDSFYCDQCGKELKVCPQCGAPGKGKVCTEHGKKLIPAKEKSQGQDQNTVINTNVNTVKSEEEQTEKKVSNYNPENIVPVAEDSTLSFVNNGIHVTLDLNDGDIIGRKKGRFSHIFASYKQISGGHAKVENKGGDWYFSDLDSSNGSKFNGEQLKPHTPVKLYNGARVILANIEFIVKMEEEQDNEKTVRL